MNIDLRRLVDEDLPLLHSWLNEPGVLRWWEGDDVSWHAVVRDYGSSSTDPTEHWLALVDGRPVGWMQCFATADYADEDYVQQCWRLGADRTSASIDYLIGDPADRGSGLGRRLIDTFVERVVFGRHPDWTQVCAAPNEANRASLGALKAAGFVHVGNFQQPSMTCCLMIRQREDASLRDLHTLPSVTPDTDG